MAIDWDRLVLGPTMAVFGEAVTYQPQGGQAFTIADAVYDEAYHAQELIDDTTHVTTTYPVLGVRLAAFPSGLQPLQGDRVSIPRANSTYIVREVDPDGHGHAKLKLNFVSSP